ncbi:DUF2207 domain-containing protein [Candidatus Peregrinibacteria bacterium]|nr:DUF2207 domain-containing protein [Candidatus Peregrinibacteria bacterium]
MLKNDGMQEDEKLATETYELYGEEKATKSTTHYAFFSMSLKFFGLSLLLISNTALAESWEISSFDAEILINKDASVEITEKIVADFTNEAHRGIARFIPFEAEGYNSQISFLSAVNDKNESWITNIYKSGGYLNIEMTNPQDEYRTTIETFLLKYLAENVIIFHNDEVAEAKKSPYDEFYWNVNGTDNPVKTKSVSAKISLPQNAKLDLTCFTGAYGEAAQDCTYEMLDDKTALFKTTRELEPYENLTIAIAIPKGIIDKIPLYKKIWWYLKDHLILGLPIGAFIVMFLLWYFKGRDEKTLRDTIMPHFTPPQNMLPTETGTLIDEKLHPQDITSTIIDYAVKGHIQINEIKEKKLLITTTDYELVLLKPYTSTKEYEKLILEEIFGENPEKGKKVRISKLMNKFYKSVPNIEKSIMKDMVTAGYFPHNPATLRKGYGIIGGIPLIIGFYSGGIGSWLFTVSLIATGIIIIIFGQILPRKTQKGAELYFQLKGLYEYIETAEKDRLNFQEKANIFFEKLLPYAVAFGLTKKWAKAFENLITSSPGWFHGYYPGQHFNMYYFADSLSRFTQRATTNIAASPRGGGRSAFSGGSGFGGGGFSGGGFGGGGSRGL